MFRHNFLLAYRSFKRYRSSFFINLVGLSTGMTCAILIYLWVSDELKVDKFNAKGDRLYSAMEHRKRSTGIWTSPTTPGPMAEALTAEYPEIEMVTQATWPQGNEVTSGETNFNALGRFAGKDFFKMFSYRLLQGNENQQLVDNQAIVISDQLAMKLFGSVDGCIGKTIQLNHKEDVHVTGVFEHMPLNASDQFEFVRPFETYHLENKWIDSWGNTGLLTHVLLKPGVDINTFNGKIADFVNRKTNNEITYRTLFMKKYSEKYLYGNYENGVLTGGRITYVKLFSIVSVFILLIACVNFMNLSTARATRRMKEIGIKKAIGSGRKLLIAQYLSESVLMSFIALLVALLMVFLLLPKFNEVTSKFLTLRLEPNAIALLLGITLFTGLVSGSYPALYLSGFNSVAVLKGKLKSSFVEAMARKGLVVFQFTLSIIFIVSVLVVYRQVEFVRSASLGYNKSNLISFMLSGALQDVRKQELLIEQAKRIPGIESASSMNHNLTGHNGGTSGVEWQGKDPQDRTEFERFFVNYDMIETLGLEMADGRSYSRDFLSDTLGIIFNENAIAFMGMKDPIGKTVKLWGQERKIIGVVKDFHYESLHETYKPVFIVLAPNETYRFVARLTAGKEKEALDQLASLYSSINPGFIFDYTFVDATYQAQYAGEERVATLSKYFAALAILISCLGLFGLAAFTAERRLKEIGIRKVLGSSEFGIVYLLSRDFTQIVMIAIVLAIPISYYISQTWLSTFAFRIPLEYWFFVAAGASGLFIAWFTVGFQALRAARVNPTQCLKNE
jgi:predicted permease